MDASGTFLAKRGAKCMDRQGAQGSSDPQCDLGVSLMCNQVLSSPDHRSPLRDSLLQQAKLDEANQARGAAHPSCPWTDLVDASSVCHPVPLCSAGSRRPRGSWYLVPVAPELALHRAMRPCANWPGRPVYLVLGIFCSRTTSPTVAGHAGWMMDARLGSHAQ
ncbi:hypothetical protein PCL_05461 [Purpureocillium lilacinum]|uniref:Uncharacterized protein n=1 Tax=Purpureocillium lilacinum TaxID=33203 RepID=A0A2U3DUQ1_PURLI|nr:hypothetical protein PCL_05461 [Purpureocillium lilacinum]